MPSKAAVLDETSTRRVLLVQAFDNSPPDNPLWTPEDRTWATRLAQQSAGAKLPAPKFIGERAHHALQRLLPRDPAAARALARRLWRPAWWLAAAALGLLVGLLADTIGASQRINLLAPPVWGVVLWNLLVYAGLLMATVLPAIWPHRLCDWLNGWLARRLAGRVQGSAVLTAFQATWARVAAPLMSARAACLLHLAAAALALGLIGSLYVRGLVLDYRAAWQSTFLDADQVRTLLVPLLSPATVLTGIAVPDVAALQALKAGPESGLTAPPTASAAPWIHLYAATLFLFVLLPRTVLASGAAVRAWHLSKRLPVPLHEPYFQRLVRAQHGGAAQVRVQPHGAPPTAAAVVGLRRVLTAVLGEPLGLQVAAATAYGEEESAAPAVDRFEDATTLCVLWVDLASTPEADTHGRFIQAQRSAAPTIQLLLCADEAAMRARFASVPTRLAERRTAWRGFAAAQGLGFVSADWSQPDLADTQAALQRALHV
jgi:Protein of unknown function (DUF2868)